MADRFWVGGTGNWSDATNHWATASGGAPGAGNLPTAADRAIFDAASNTTAYTMTVDVSAVCLDLLFNAAPSVSGTITWAGLFAMTISGGLTMLAGMTRNISATLTFNATSGTRVIRSSGVAFANSIIFNGAGAIFQLADDLTMSGGAVALRLTAGTFDANGKTVVMNGTSPFIQGALPFTLFNLSRIGTSGAKTDSLNIENNVTVTGTLTITGNSITNRMLVQSAANSVVIVGSQRTVTAAAVSLSNVDFMDIAGAGAATWSGTSVGDAGGNTGISFTAPTTRYWVAGTGGNWSATTSWAASSGGASGVSVPLCHDAVVIDSLSIGSAGRTIVTDMPRAGKDISFAGVLNTPTWNVAANTGVSVFGSLTLASGLTATVGSGGALSLAARSAALLTTAGVALPHPFTIAAFGATVTLADALTLTQQRLNVTAGTFADAGFSVTADSYGASSGTGLVKSGLWTLSGNGNVWADNVTTSISDTGTTKFTSTDSLTKNIICRQHTYGVFWISGKSVAPYAFNAPFNNSFAEIKVTAANTVQFTAGNTQTVSAFTVNGQVPGGSDRTFGQTFGTSTSFFSTPDAPALRIVGDVDIRAEIAPQDWTPTLNGSVVSKDGNRYMLRVNTNGTLIFTWFDGATQLTQTSSAVVPASSVDGSISYVRAVLDVDNGAGGNDVKFYTSPDYNADTLTGTWNQLGTTQTGAGITTIGGYSTGSLKIGISDSSPLLAMKVYRVQVFNGIAGTLVADLKPSLYTGGATWVGPAGLTWTKNGEALIAATNQVALGSITPASHTLAKNGGGYVGGDNVSLDRSTATPANTWFAGSHSVDGGNNSGWFFNDLVVAQRTGSAAGTSAASGAAMWGTRRVAAPIIAAVNQPPSIIGVA